MKIPALTITMSSLLILRGTEERVSIAARASVMEVLSILMSISLLPSAFGRSKRALAAWDSVLRTLPMTVVLDRWRYFWMKPLPMPVGEMISWLEM